MKITIAFPPLRQKGAATYGFWSRLRSRTWGGGKKKNMGGKESKPPQVAAKIDGGEAPRGDGPPAKIQKRKKHPTEVPPIPSKDYGKIVFEFRDKDAKGFVDERGDPLRITDLYEHFLVFGGSGTGKTYSVLQPMWEEWFRSTHLPEGEERERKKFGALVIEAKGDFRDKTWALAQKYGRMDDCVFFGPTHRDVVYDMFGDPTESPLQLANKMLAMLKAFSGGQGTQDPFWDNAARKLFQSIFIMHRAVKAAENEAATPQDKEKYKVEAMSFGLLNLMLMDRGQPRNQAQVAESQQQFNEMWSKFQQALEELIGIGTRLTIDLSRLEPYVLTREAELKKLTDGDVEKEEDDGDDELEASEDALKYEDEIYGENSDEPPFAVENRKEVSGLTEYILHIRRSLARLNAMLAEPGEDGDTESTVSKLEEFVATAQVVLATQDDTERGEAAEKGLTFAKELSASMRKKFNLIDEETTTGDSPVGPDRKTVIKCPRGLDGTKELMVRFIDAAGRMAAALERLSKHKGVAPAMGALKTLLGQYEEILKEKQIEPQLDTIWAYFSEEYLNMANEKTAGSVAMVATNLVSIFVHPPYSEIFASKATFNFNMAIDQGKIVYLDMPSSYYGAAATVAAIAFKIDFFRCMLSRPRLTVRNPDGTQGEALVNQERPMSYFCDEFASIVSTGDETGEAGFMDKVREFKCGCLLGTQSIPMLLKKISEHEVDAILTNTACKLFLRNTDIKTNEYASKILGSEIKVNANLNQGAAESVFGEGERPVGSRAFSTNYSRGARFDVGDFTRLQKGQAIVVLNSRFGTNQIQKLSFKGKAAPPMDSSPPWALPTTHPY